MRGLRCGQGGNEADRILGEYWTRDAVAFSSRRTDGASEPRPEAQWCAQVRRRRERHGLSGRSRPRRSRYRDGGRSRARGRRAHMGTRAGGVDLATRANFSRQVDPLTRCMPLAAWRHTSKETSRARSRFSTPNGFLTPGTWPGSGQRWTSSNRVGSCREHRATVCPRPLGQTAHFKSDSRFPFVGSTRYTTQPTSWKGVDVSVRDEVLGANEEYTRVRRQGRVPHAPGAKVRDPYLHGREAGPWRSTQASARVMPMSSATPAAARATTPYAPSLSLQVARHQRSGS